jgi:hypothetical protein
MRTSANAALIAGFGRVSPSTKSLENRSGIAPQTILDCYFFTALPTFASTEAIAAVNRPLRSP